MKAGPSATDDLALTEASIAARRHDLSAPGLGNGFATAIAP
ncbi:MAG: hypothetical protein ACHQ15_06735 [Candidatus Limnocylindrales bacterium]